MKITNKEIEKIKPYKLNAKRHPQSQIEGIAESIKRFGFTQPVVCDKDGTIIIGHGRVEAAKLAGLKTVPVVEMNELSEQEVKALRLIDNRIAETGWDNELLVMDLQDFKIDIKPFNIDFDFLADHILNENMEGLTDPDEVPEVVEPVVKLGDVWLLGEHRLMCGDSTKKEDVERLLGEKEPYLMITDPPYGVEYDPNWRNEADRANGKKIGAGATGIVKNDSKADWTAAWELSPSKVAYVWHAGKFCGLVAESLARCDFEIRSQIIWAKNNFVISRGDYHWKHEPCWYAVKKGSKGNWAGNRSQTTVWDIDKPMKSETGHGTQKPVECMERPMRNHDGDVYEPFSGSGTTFIAAEKTNRKCYGMELDPHYCDVIIKRWEDFTGKKAEKE